MRDTWREKFREYCEKIEGEQGSYTGIYECGYHWCCDECYCQFSKGCLDCVVTIEQILQRNGVNIDYADYDFEKWENLAKQAYKREYELKVQTKKEHYVCEVVKKTRY